MINIEILRIDDVNFLNGIPCRCDISTEAQQCAAYKLRILQFAMKKKCRSTSLDAVFERLLAVTENLFHVLRLIGNVETVSHDLLQRLRMVEVEHLAGAIVALANVIQQQFHHGAQELRRFHLPRRTCNRHCSPERWTVIHYVRGGDCTSCVIGKKTEVVTRNSCQATV